MHHDQDFELPNVEEVKDWTYLIFGHVWGEDKRSQRKLGEEIFYSVRLCDICDTNKSFSFAYGKFDQRKDGDKFVEHLFAGGE